METIGTLTIGTVINYTNNVTATNTNYVILSHYTDKWGYFTKVLNMETLDLDEFTNHTPMTGLWSIIKEN